MMQRLISLATTLEAVVALQHSSGSTRKEPLEIAEQFGEYDQQLGVNSFVDDSSCISGWHAINPSFARSGHGTELAVAFKGACLRQSGENGIEWDGSVVLGTVRFGAIRNDTRSFMPWESLQLAPDPRFRLNSMLKEEECVEKSFERMAGVDDVKLMMTNAGLYAVVNGYMVREYEGEGRPGCGVKGILSYAAKVKSLDPPAFDAPAKITFPGMGFIVKSWPMFVARENEGAQVRAVYSVYPHRIALVDLQSGKVNFEGHAYSAAVEALARQWNTQPGKFQTGAAIAHVNTDDTEYFLGFMHMKARQANKTLYLTFPYKFARHAPYNILHVGEQLDLKGLESMAHGHMTARVTTSMFDKGYIFIAYGAGDRNSRTIRMPLAEFEARYFDEQRSFFERALRRSDDFDVFANALEADAVRAAESEPCANTLQVESCSDPLVHSVCRSCHK